MITIVLPGSPKGQGRPRSHIVKTRDGRQFIAVYKDAASRTYEEALALTAKTVMKSRPPLEGPLVVEVDAIFAVPPSWSMKQRDAALAGVVRPIGRPDIDNVLKSVLDGLANVVFRNDSQIVLATVEKRYGERPMLFIEVSECEPFTG